MFGYVFNILTHRGNTNENYMEILLLRQNGIISKCWGGRTLACCRWDCQPAQSLVNHYGGSWRIKHQTTIWLSCTTTSSVLKGLLIFQRGRREEQNIYDNTDQTELLHIAAQPLWKMFDSIHYAKQWLLWSNNFISRYMSNIMNAVNESNKCMSTVCKRPKSWKFQVIYHAWHKI